MKAAALFAAGGGLLVAAIFLEAGLAPAPGLAGVGVIALAIGAYDS